MGPPLRARPRLRDPARGASGGDDGTPPRVRWARLRFSIIGPLLASPPESGELAVALDEVALRSYLHPTTGERVRFGRSTIERWLYAARNAPTDPMSALERKVHARAGTHPSIGAKLAEALRAQHRAHPRWSYQLHHDNVCAQARIEPGLGAVPSRITITRYMKGHGMVRPWSKKQRAEIAHGLVPRETRSYEVSHVGALWHLDAHKGRRRVLMADGTWAEARLYGVIDDYSRVGCHVQWYCEEGESTESVAHSLLQGFQKRGLPRALLSDNGSGICAAESSRLKACGPLEPGSYEVFVAVKPGGDLASNHQPQATSSSKFQHSAAIPSSPRFASLMCPPLPPEPSLPAANDT